MLPVLRPAANNHDRGSPVRLITGCQILDERRCFGAPTKPPRVDRAYPAVRCHAVSAGVTILPDNVLNGQTQRPAFESQ